VSVNSFLATIAANGGMSYSNNFVVRFLNPPVTPPGGQAGDYFEYFCSEAQLPNINTAQGQINGMYVGSGSVSYPHTRVFTEFQLGFLCDANMSALKFLQDWVDFIFDEGGDTQVGKSLSEIQSLAYGPIREENRNVRVKYRDNYARTIAISKTEQGPRSTTERVPITYILEKAYPYAIDAIPLQFGSSQVTQVTAQFSYMRHYVIKNDISGIKSDITALTTQYKKNVN